MEPKNNKLAPNKLHKAKQLLSSPLALGILGWIFFPGMYLLVGILTWRQFEVTTAFWIASPLGALGFFAWVGSVVATLRKSVWQSSPIKALAGILLSIPPLLFLVFGLIVAFRGGV